MFRIVGWLMLFIGIYLLFTPIINVLNWIPLVGWLFASGVSLVALIIAFVFSLIFTFLTIAIAWLYYRPLYGILMIVAIGAVSGLVLFTARVSKPVMTT